MTGLFVTFCEFLHLLHFYMITFLIFFVFLHSYNFPIKAIFTFLEFFTGKKHKNTFSRAERAEEIKENNIFTRKHERIAREARGKIKKKIKKNPEKVFKIAKFFHYFAKSFESSFAKCFYPFLFLSVQESARDAVRIGEE